MRENKIRTQMLEGIPVLGPFQSFPSPNIVEMFGYTGYDFVILDMEHGYSSIESCAAMIRACEAADITPIVRISHLLRPYVLRILDIGAQGLMLPSVKTRDEVEEFLHLAKYAPMGARGFAFETRASEYGITDVKNTHVETSNREILSIIQLETKECHDNLDDILQVENLDVVFVGPFDFAQALGYTAQVDHPFVQETILKDIQKIIAAGKIAGIHTRNHEDSRKWIEAGARFISCRETVIIGDSMNAYMQKFLEIAGRK